MTDDRETWMTTRRSMISATAVLLAKTERRSGSRWWFTRPVWVG